MLALALAATLGVAEVDSSVPEDILAPLRSLVGEARVARAGELPAPPAPVAAPGSPESPAAEAALSAEGGSRGELRFSASTRATFAGVTVGLAGTTASGEHAPQRASAQLQLETPRFRTLLDVTPGSEGLWRAAGELEARQPQGAVALLARTTALADSTLRGLGVRAEADGALFEGVQVGASATAWALWLSSRSSWAELGAATLDWCELGDLSAWVSARALGATLTPGVSASLPAQGGFELRPSLTLEIAIGGVRLQAGGSAARLFAQETWLFGATAGVAVPLR